MFNILLVDDEAINAEGLRVLIRHLDLGFDSIELAHNGAEALEKMKLFRPDIIITDIRMPIMDGLQLMQRIRESADNQPQAKIIVLSGYEDFSYAQQAIRYQVHHYLLKPVRQPELYNVLLRMKADLEQEQQLRLLGLEERALRRKADELLRDQCFEQILSRKLKSDDEILNKLEKCGIATNAGPYLLIAFEPYLDREAVHHLTHHYELTFFGLRNIAEEICAAEQLAPDCFHFNQHLLLLLPLTGSNAAQTAESVRSALESSIANFDIYLKIRVHAGVSQIFNNAARLVEAYAECCYALRHKLTEPDEKLHWYDRLSDRQKSGPLFLVETQQIINAFEIGKRHIISEQLDRVKQEIVRMDRPSIHYIENVYYNIYLNVYSYYLRKKKNLSAGSDMTEFSSMLHSAESMEDINRHIRQRLGSIFDLIYGSMEENLPLPAKLMGDALQYIEDNFDKDVTLTSMAGELNVSPTYLSKRFKQETGVSFQSYITQKRIEKAKKLLRETQKPVSEIGSTVGYTSEKHFFAVFKTYCGVSPLKYRNM